MCLTKMDMIVFFNVFIHISKLLLFNLLLSQFWLTVNNGGASTSKRGPLGDDVTVDDITERLALSRYSKNGYKNYKGHCIYNCYSSCETFSQFDVSFWDLYYSPPAVYHHILKNYNISLEERRSGPSPISLWPHHCMIVKILPQLQIAYLHIIFWEWYYNSLPCAAT